MRPRPTPQRRRPPPALRPAPPLPVRIHFTQRGDFAELLAIEHAATDRPWTAEDFAARLACRNCVSYVAVRDEPRDRPGAGPVLGHLVFAYRRDHYELIRLAVDPAFAGRGVGSTLLGELASKLGPGRRGRLEATVPESGLDTLVWLRGRRWRAEELVWGHFGADAGIRMVYRMDEDDTGCEEAR